MTGVAAGSSNVTITSPVVSYHFDFVNDSGTGNATSPTAPGYLTVLPNTVYQGTTQPFGWQSSGLVSGFNDGTTDANASPPLTPPAFSNNATVNTDLAEAGQAGNSATFDVAVAAGHTYTLTFYLGDALQAHEMTITVSGGTVTIDPHSDGGLITTGTPPPSGNGTLGRGAGGWLKFTTSPFTATSSTLAITFTGVQPGGLDGNFALDGLDVIDPPGPPAPTVPTLAPAGLPPVNSAVEQTMSPPVLVVQSGSPAPTHDRQGLYLDALAQVQALAAADRLLPPLPAIAQGQPLQKLDEAGRTQLLREVAAALNNLPGDPLDGLASADSATALGPDEIDHLFNADWLNGLDG